MIFKSYSAATLGRAAIVILLALGGRMTNIVAAQTANFGFRFEFGPCYPWVTERLDTFNGVFIATIGGEPARTVTARMSLTKAQMSEISETVESIKFFDYPSTFVGVAVGVRESTTTRPASTYRFEVRRDGAVHTVSWEDAYKPSSPEADRLREFFSRVRGFIHEHPAFKRLPHPAVACQ